jgi:hypothetical protein
MTHSVADDSERDCRGRLVEPDQVPLRPRTRREALRADVERLEEVRLAGPVLADHEDDSGCQREVEGRIRAEVSERDVGDDQPASRIGMIR